MNSSSSYEDAPAQNAPVRNLIESVEGEVEEEIPFVDAQLLDFPEVKDEASQEERERLLEEKRLELERDPSVKAADYNYSPYAMT